jgi:hypothetical protein
VAAVLVLASVTVGNASAARPIHPRGCADAWTVAAQPPFVGSGGLDDVSALSPTNFWGVGGVFTESDQIGHTLIQHFDGTSWSTIASADGPGGAPQSSLSGVSAVAADDAWAVGAHIRPNNLVRTLIERWDGLSWTRVTSPNAGQPAGGQLGDVVALEADDAWAVGSYGQGAPSRTLVEHWDGTSWSVVPSPNKGPFPNSLTAVDAVAADDIWAAGTWFTKAFVDRTLILHWDGVSWQRVKGPNAGPTGAANDVVDIAAMAADDVWAVGVRGLRTLILHWDGVAWSAVPSPTPGGNADLAGVVAVAADDVWAVGGRVDRQENAIQTLVEHWDGATWSVVESANKGPSDNHLWAVTAAPGRMIAVGYRFVGSGLGSLAPLVLERCAP